MKKRLLYALAAAGITAVTAQIILIREFFTSFYGNELSVGFVLGIWLAGGAIGSGIFGRFFADRIRKKVLLFAAIQLILSALLPASILFARTSKIIFGIGAGEIVGLPVFIVSSGAALLPIAASLGFLFVLGCKVFPGEEAPARIGSVYTIEAFGAMLGGAVTSLLLIRYLGPLQIAFILSGINLLSAYFLTGTGAPTRLNPRDEKPVPAARRIAITLMCLFGLFVIFGGVKFLDRKSADLKWKDFNVLVSGDSAYGRVTVTEKSGQLNFFGNGLFLFSSHDPLIAEEAVHFLLASTPDVKRVLLIGGGASEITAEILKYPVEKIDYVELNPLVISFSKEFLRNQPFYRLDDPRVNVINEDGRYFIKNVKDRYDAVIVSLPNPYTAQINRFYTKQFFREVKRVLNEGGGACFSVTSSENYLSKAQALFLKTLYETAKAEFAEVRIVPGDTAHFLLSNRPGAISLKPAAIRERLRSAKVNTLYVRDYYMFSKLSEERLEFLNSVLRGAGRVQKNMDFYPVSYFYDMVLWSAYFSFKLSGFFMFFTGGYLLALTALFMAGLYAVFFVRRRGKNFKKDVTLLALFTTGLSEISFEILIVLAFQIIYGYLYYKVGIIVTSFMFGLALGSLCMTQRLNRIPRPFKTYINIQVLVLVYPLLLLVCFKAFSALSAHPALRRISSDFFGILPFVAGFVGGMQYPLANKICFERTGLVGKIAGTTYAIDLAGSFIGAGLLCAFFVPMVGIPATCVLVAGLNAVSLALLLLARK